ncbi:hypothetical protein [Tautonia sociabilis]|uniref:Glycosyltransferase RgtA/B/C/D-like domain-containing protein n=1 Tax=Tautonia sociabilis TaxID=2080755 RepID=A0A432MJH2_9BACT|nr:hypothetical protein [Tautonia sociabilis]RUL87288.1 hypothetical protein TsocGM_12980 [Tautonia sociabilis]
MDHLSKTDGGLSPVPPTAPNRRVARAVAIAGLAAVLVVAAWFRLSSLGATPPPGADEAFYGLQAWRLAFGGSPRMHTVTGNLIDPFLVLPQAPLYWFVEPSAWVPRLPVAISGILASGLALPLLRRVLDGPTALTAAVLIATMPVAIVFSRFGCEFGQTPLAGVIAACCALRGQIGWLVVSVALALLVHPTNVFLVPILGPVAIVRLVDRARSDPAKARRAWWSLGAMASASAAAAVWLLTRSEVRVILEDRFTRIGEMDWGRFLDGYRTTTAQGPWLPIDPGVESAVVGTAALALLVVGTFRQARRRQWDRIALALGLGLGMTGLHLLGGPQVLHTDSRYGAVLISPSAIVLACWLQALFPRVAPGDPRPGGASRIALTAALGAMLLVVVERNRFEHFRQVAGESIWTFRAESEDPYRMVLDRIRADLARELAQGLRSPGAPPRLILAQDYFISVPLEFLLQDDPALEVVELVSIPQLGEFVGGGDPMSSRLPRIAERLAAGDYAVRGGSAAVKASQFLEELIATSFPPDRVRRWDIPNHPELRIYRIRPEPNSALALGEPGSETVGR